MPELPDVEGFKRVLARRALRKRIDQVVVSDARILGKLSPRTFRTRLRGGRLVEVRRHGKHLLARLDPGGWLTLHFGMTGALQFVNKSDGAPPFARVRLDFARDGSLVYTNTRMIGRVGLAKDAADFIAAEKLGPDALDRSFDFDAFKAAMGGLKRDVKSALMDQQIVAGIGNIYSDEILFQARINPAARVDRLTPGQLRRLFANMRKVLKTAVSRGAGSEQFVERMPKGSLLPQRKKGGRCRSRLKVFKVGGCTAYCCAKCQGN
jgi:formamidopyrimidine-DNA glycosylase